MDYYIKIPNEKRFNEVVSLLKKLGYVWWFANQDYYVGIKLIFVETNYKKISFTSGDTNQHAKIKKLSYKQLKTLVEVKL